MVQCSGNSIALVVWSAEHFLQTMQLFDLELTFGPSVSKASVEKIDSPLVLRVSRVM
jgi:hypothetical protein